MPALAAGQAKHRHKKPVAAKKQAAPDPTPQPPPPPPPPPTLEQMPAVPPKVTYQYGLLTIVARNSVLSDVLQAVKAKTGANIDIPPGASERVVAQIGPGPARDVLAKLLNGTHFNYVMLGTASNPNAVATLILTPSSGGPEPGPVAGQQPGMGQPGMPQPGMPQPYPNQAYPNQPQSYQPGMQAQNPGEQGSDRDTMVDQDNGQDNAEAPEDTNNEQANGNENQQNPNQPQVKTPEQLLQELQRQQQQQQQQGQQPESQSGQPQMMRPQPQIVYPPQQPPQQQQQPQ